MFSLKKSLLAVVLSLSVLVGLFSQGVLAQQDHTNAEYTDVEAYAADLQAIVGKSNVEAALYFTPFGSADGGFKQYALSDRELEIICGGRECGPIGANFGTYFKGADYSKPRDWGMQYTLEIVRNRNENEANNTAGVIANESENVIVRIGTKNGGAPGFEPATGSRADIETAATNYAEFLRSVHAKAGYKSFFAIAGPNEPDIETWAWAGSSTDGCPSPPNASDDPATKQAFYDCAGEKLAWYMNKVIEVTADPGIKLLSPAFNMSTFMFNDGGNGIKQSMEAAGANFGGLYGYAGNLYPVGKSMQAYWADQDVDGVFAGKPIIITETAFNASGETNSLESDGYDLSMFNDYDVNGDDWYIHPIDGLGAGDEVALDGTRFDAISPDMRTHYVRDDLIRQGYEAHCAAPAFNIEMTVTGQQWMTQFLKDANSEYWPAGAGNPGIIMGGSKHFYPSINQKGEDTPGFSRLEIDYKDANTPVMRDTEGKQWLLSSLEEFFGFKDTVTGNNYGGGRAEVNSAAVNSLLSNVQRCVQVGSLLYQQHLMCTKLDDPDSCSLYNRQITDTDYDVKQLFTELGAYHQNVMADYPGQDDVKLTCQRLMGTREAELSEQEVKMRQAIEYMPLNIDRAYRLAFLVTSIRLKPASTQSVFNFFTKPTGGGIPDVEQPKNEVLVVAFKVPDITTNKGNISLDALNENENVAFYDPSKLTRDSLLLKKQTDAIDENRLVVRNALYTVARNTYDPRGASPRVQNENDDEIYCALDQDESVLGTSGVNSPACKDPLGKALVDLINAQANLTDALGSSAQVYSVKDDPEGDFLSYNMIGNEDLPYLYQLDDVGDCNADKQLQVEQALEVHDAASLHPLADATHVFTVDRSADLLNNLMNIVTNLREQDACGGGSNFDPNYAGTEADDRGNCRGIAEPNVNSGLKTLFHVVPDLEGWPYNAENDAREVRQYLVYPEGYDMKMLEAVLAGTFFTEDQQRQLAEEASAYDRIEIDSDKLNFSGANETYSYDDNLKAPEKGGDFWRNGPPWDCTRTDNVPVGFTPTGEIIYENQEVPERCTRVFGYNISLQTPVESAKLLGGKLGFWVRSVQKNFYRLTSVPRQYLEGCTSTEEFLLGKCGQQEVALAGSPTPPIVSKEPICGMPELLITNSSTNFEITKGTSGDEVSNSDPGYFLDARSPHTLNVATRYLDGSSLVLLDKVIPVNPKSCASYEDTSTEIWYLPEDTNFINSEDNRDETDNFIMWREQATKLRLKDVDRTNGVYQLKVKPGYYYIHIDSTPCIMDKTLWVADGFGPTQNDREKLERVVYVGENNLNPHDAVAEKSHFCARVNLQTAMAGGDSDELIADTSINGYEPQCSLGDGYPVQANNSCGGRAGGSSEDEDDGAFWKDAYDNGLPGFNTYKNIMGFDFPDPRNVGDSEDDFQCRDLLPNVIREYDCSGGGAIDNNDLPTSGGVDAGDIDVDYRGTTPLPATGIATGYSYGVMDSVWRYRSQSAGQINPSVYNLKTCEVPGAAFIDAKQAAINMNNGTAAGNGAYTGCAAMLRLGDIPFYPRTGQPPRTVWVKSESSGLIQGPILIIDVAAEKDLPHIYNRFGGRWVIDLDRHSLERFGNGFNPTDGITVCSSPTC